MSSTKNACYSLFMIVALLLLSACDDDERKNKKTQYDVTIYVSEHIKGEIVHVPGERSFAKPRIVVQAPEGVKVEHDETKPRKNIVYDFTPIGLMLSLFLALLLFSSLHPRLSRFSFSPPPTYQRG